MKKKNPQRQILRIETAIIFSFPHLVKCGLRHGEVEDSQLLEVVGQHVKNASQAAGVWRQLVLQHVLVAFLQLDAGKGLDHVVADRTAWMWFAVGQSEDDGVAITEPAGCRAEQSEGIIYMWQGFYEV